MSSSPREVSPKRRRVEKKEGESGKDSGAEEMETDYYEAGKSLLEELPAELIGKVIEFSSVRGLLVRQTSHNMRAKIDDFAKKSTLPLVSALSFGAFRLPNSDSKPDKVDVYFDVNRDAVGLFYLQRYLKGETNFKKDIRLWEGKTEGEVPFIENWTMFGAELHLDEKATQKKLDQLKQWCGKRIGVVKLNGVTEPKTLKKISETLKGIPFSLMYVCTDQMSEDVAQNFVTMMLEHQVKAMKLSGRFETKIDTVPVLHQLSQHLHTMHIYQTPKAAAAEGAVPIGTKKYLFGASDADWATIIMDMFNGALDKLAIVNPPHAGYLTTSASDRLISELPTINKRVWFVATCDSYPTGIEADKRKNYVIKVTMPKNPPGQAAPQQGSDTKCKQYLEIKHVTRLNEKALDEIPLEK